MKGIIAITLCLIIFLASCSPKYTWIHPNSERNNEYTYNIDVSNCDMYAQQEKMSAYSEMRGNPFAGFGMIAVYDRAFLNCMSSKGWLKVAEEDTTKKQKSISNEDKGNQMSKADKRKEKIISSELGGKPLDAEAIFMLLKNGEKVALLIIVEEVSSHLLREVCHS